MQHFDLAVVGGGFAGLECARAAATRCLNVVVLEKKPSVDARTHTTGILVKEVADMFEVPRNLTRKIHGVRLYAPNLSYVDLVSPGYYFLATDTLGMMRWMAEQAQAAGAEVRSGASVQEIEATLDGYQLPGGDLGARFLAACDGAKSSLARQLRLSENRRFLIGQEHEFKGVHDIDTDRLHVFLDSQLARGYIAWVVPGVEQTQVGLAARHPRKLQLDRFIEKVSGLFDFSKAEITNTRAGLIPCGGPLRKLGSERALLVGDAAGMVSPLTAGGIHTALAMGHLAGVSIADYLLDGGPLPANVVRKASPTFRTKRYLRTMFDLCPPPNFSYNLFLGNPLFRRLAQTVFFHHRGLRSMQAWRDLVSPTS